MYVIRINIAERAFETNGYAYLKSNTKAVGHPIFAKKFDTLILADNYITENSIENAVSEPYSGL